MISWYIFPPDVKHDTSEAHHDTAGWTLTARPAKHPANGADCQVFEVPDGTPNGNGCTLQLTDQHGKKRYEKPIHGVLYVNLPTGAGLVVDVLPLLSASSASLPLEALHLQGRHGFYTPAGTYVPLTGATGFRLVELVATGNLAAAEAFLDAMTPARTIRVLTMAKHLFQLDPRAGRPALANTLELAAARGKYLSVVALADTKSFTFDIEHHVREVGAMCAHYPACAFLEIGNELSPLHSTQDDRLGDLAFLKHLRSLVPSSVAVSLGSTHADQDESDIFKDGDLLTIHGSRDDGDNGWRFVRHTNEQRALADRVGRYAVNDEPKRSDLAPDKHLGLALLCRLFRLGDTFHFGSGLQCQSPTGAELAAFQARARGWAAIPDDWLGQYENTGFAGSPVKSFDGAVRIYSSVRGGEAYSLVLGATPGLRIDWRDDWPNRDLVLAEGGCHLWQVTR